MSKNIKKFILEQIGRLKTESFNDTTRENMLRYFKNIWPMTARQVITEPEFFEFTKYINFQDGDWEALNTEELQQLWNSWSDADKAHDQRMEREDPIRKAVRRQIDEEMFEKPVMFEDMNWKQLHDILISNTNNDKKYAPGTMQSIFITKEDLIKDGDLTDEEYEILEDHNIISTMDFYPIILDEKYLDFNVFFEAVKKLWNEKFPISSGNYGDNASLFQ